MHTCLALDPLKGLSAQLCNFRQELSLRNYHGNYVAVKNGFTYQRPNRETNNAAVCTPTVERNQKRCSIFYQWYQLHLWASVSFVKRAGCEVGNGRRKRKKTLKCSVMQALTPCKIWTAFIFTHTFFLWNNFWWNGTDNLSNFRKLQKLRLWHTSMNVWFG